jgi:hypothetical protein
MTEPKRWVDDGAPVAIERMLRAAGDEQPSSSSLERTLAGVGVGTAVLTSTTGSAAAGSAAKVATATAATAIFTKWNVLVVVVAGGLGLATGIAIVRDEPVVSTVRDAKGVAGVAVQPKSASLAPRPGLAAPVESATPALPAAADPDRAGVRRLASLGEPARAAEPVDTTFLEETSSIDRARAALDAGNPAGAITVLDAYEARFKAPRYAAEALYLRMKALLAQGNTVAAQRVATRLLSAYPNSPWTARARAAVGRTNP